MTVRRQAATTGYGERRGNRISEVVTRLEQRYPQIDADTVADIARSAYQHFSTAPVRDFVPLLVERNVDRVLSNSS
ncbi:three-helix bundle dimerization domain-containing protein [Nocardia sp. NPDC055029]|uniref:three-helix bundle dimerization domain-containing protein n=1 Tax=Nocardia sp. NPDC060259 TaxID=3347088 RepID=UPI00365B0C18